MNSVVEGKSDSLQHPAQSVELELQNREVFVEVLSRKPEKLDIDSNSANIFQVSDDLLSLLKSRKEDIYVRI
jgi:hypothetical protein